MGNKMLAGNIHYAAWPQLFRVRAFRIAAQGGFEDLGTFPLETLKVGDDGGWSWLTNQLVSHRLLTTKQVADSRIEHFNGRSIAASDKSGRRFLVLMPV